MFKKITPIVALAMSLVFAPAAVAWDEVCVKLPFGKAWFAANFYVVHDFSIAHGQELPGYYYDSGRETHLALPGTFAGNNKRFAAGRITSSNISAGRSTCVNISHLPEGAPFFVYVQASVFSGSRLCSNHSSNPNKWYNQTHRPFRQIWYQSTGVAGSPNCYYWKEG